MSAATKIEWCDSTFNPWIGCTRVSPACDDCYAARSTPARALGIEWGFGQPRKRTGAANWKLPERWNRTAFIECRECGWRGEDGEPDGGGIVCPNCRADEPFREARRRVFCASLSDWLDNEVPIEWLVDLLDLIHRTPNLDWLLLTKRIGNWERRITLAADYLRALYLGKPVPGPDGAFVNWMDAWLGGNPPANVWIGSTIVSRPEMLRDGPKLKQVPARVLFWSVEPMIADLGDIPRELTPDWIIVGGESGPKARPMHPDCARGLRDQCQQAGVPFLFKQWGEHNDCGEPVGKKSAGRLLDGRTWDEFPKESA